MTVGSDRGQAVQVCPRGGGGCQGCPHPRCPPCSRHLCAAHDNVNMSVFVGRAARLHDIVSCARDTAIASRRTSQRGNTTKQSVARVAATQEALVRVGWCHAASRVLLCWLWLRRTHCWLCCAAPAAGGSTPPLSCAAAGPRLPMSSKSHSCRGLNSEDRRRLPAPQGPTAPALLAKDAVSAPVSRVCSRANAYCKEAYTIGPWPVAAVADVRGDPH